MPDYNQEAIDAQLAKMQADFDARMAEMEQRHADELAASRSVAVVNPGHLVPEHGGGPGLAVRATWSQYDQELALRGEWKEPETAP